MGTTRFAANGLARLAYEVSGPEGGSVVALLHATLGDRASLGPVREALVADGFRVLIPDARGHGGSAALTNPAFTVTDMANDLFAVLDAEKLMRPGTARVHLVGYGQGAVAVLELARWRPDGVASLTLIEPEILSVINEAADPDVATVREAARQANRDAAEAAYKDQSDRAISLYLDRRWGRGWKERLSRPRQTALHRHAGALTFSLAALDAYGLTRGDVAAVRIPVLVLVAGSTPAAERAVAMLLAEWLPAAELADVPDLPGGAPFTAAGERAVTRIVAFLAARTAA